MLMITRRASLHSLFSLLILLRSLIRKVMHLLYLSWLKHIRTLILRRLLHLQLLCLGRQVVPIVSFDYVLGAVDTLRKTNPLNACVHFYYLQLLEDLRVDVGFKRCRCCRSLDLAAEMRRLVGSEWTILRHKLLQLLLPTQRHIPFLRGFFFILPASTTKRVLICYQ